MELQEIIFIITSIVSIASIIARITPTKTDDKYVGYLLQFIDVIAINNTPTKVNKK